MNQNRYSLNVYSLRVNESAPLPNGEKINGPDRARQILSVYFSEHRDDREHMIALALTNQLEILGIVKVAEGGSATTIVDPKVLFRTLMVSGACPFVLGHNHPSGHPYPSPEDLALTKRIRQCGELLNLQCLDHFIFGDGTNHVVSMAESHPSVFTPDRREKEEENNEKPEDYKKVGLPIIP